MKQKIADVNQRFIKMQNNLSLIKSRYQQDTSSPISQAGKLNPIYITDESELKNKSGFKSGNESPARRNL